MYVATDRAMDRVFYLDQSIRASRGFVGGGFSQGYCVQEVGVVIVGQVDVIRWVVV